MTCGCKRKDCFLSQKTVPTSYPGAEFRPGQIKRVRFWNFVGYTYSIVYVVPVLGLMVDPTDDKSMGKAIYVGLGGVPERLKLKSLDELVTSGQNHFTVEIILVNDGGKSDILIERSYDKTQRKSFWMVDGKSSKAAAVTAILERLKVPLTKLFYFYG